MSLSDLIPNPGEPLFGVIDSLDSSALGQCLNGTAQVITAMGLPGFPPERVSIRGNAYMDPQRDVTPLCVVSLYGFRHRPSEGTNSETVAHYLVLASFHWSGERTAAGKAAQCYYATERTVVAFSKRHRELTSIRINAEGACLKQITVDSAETLNQEAWRQGYTVSHVIIDFTVRLPYPASIAA